MKDRVPTYPGRVTLTPVPGQTNTYDMTRADAPQAGNEGTPLNKAHLLTDDTATALGLNPSNDPSVNDALAVLPTLMVNIASFSSLPKTVSNAAIKADHIVIHSELGTPSAQTGDWTVTTAAGSLTISGTISGSTTLKLILGRAGKTI